MNSRGDSRNIPISDFKLNRVTATGRVSRHTFFLRRRLDSKIERDHHQLCLVSQALIEEVDASSQIGSRKQELC